jgi:transcriptional regulator with XRE-family HTH domain
MPEQEHISSNDKLPEEITPIDWHVISFVKKIRLAKDITQEGLGDLLGVKRTFIASIESKKERAKYNLQHINTLAFYWDMSPQEFLPKEAIDPALSEKEESE